jgi:hypothetical protein
VETLTVLQFAVVLLEDTWTILLVAVLLLVAAVLERRW